MNPSTKLTLNIASIIFATLLIAPTAAIVASWNSLPGDTLYPTKRTLETVALAVTAPNYSTNSSLQTQLIARRTDEATDTILKKSSSKGLDELRAQLQDLNRQIDAAPTVEAKQTVAKKAVTQLRKTRQKLAQTKTTLAQRPTTIHTTTIITQTIIQEAPTSAGQTPPTQAPQTPPDTSTPTTEPPQQQAVVPEEQDDLIEEIVQTEDQIEDAIEQIEEQIIEELLIEPTLPPTDNTEPGQGRQTAPGQKNNSSRDDQDDND